jgi:hypothetical protein
MAKLQVDILETGESGEQEKLGTIVLEDGTLSAPQELEYIFEVYEEVLGPGQKGIKVGDDPSGWLRSLYRTISGSYLRATEARE